MYLITFNQQKVCLGPAKKFKRGPALLPRLRRSRCCVLLQQQHHSLLASVMPRLVHEKRKIKQLRDPQMRASFVGLLVGLLLAVESEGYTAPHQGERAANRGCRGVRL